MKPRGDGSDASCTTNCESDLLFFLPLDKVLIEIENDHLGFIKTSNEEKRGNALKSTMTV